MLPDVEGPPPHMVPLSPSVERCITSRGLDFGKQTGGVTHHTVSWLKQPFLNSFVPGPGNVWPSTSRAHLPNFCGKELLRSTSLWLVISSFFKKNSQNLSSSCAYFVSKCLCTFDGIIGSLLRTIWQISQTCNYRWTQNQT